MGASSFRGFSQGIPEPHLKRGRGGRPHSFAADGNEGKRRKEKMKLLMKILINIILLPVLPIRIGWKLSAGAKASNSTLFGKVKNGRVVHSEEMDSSSSRLIGTIFVAGIIYYGIAQGFSYLLSRISSRPEANQAPVVEQQGNVEQSKPEIDKASGVEQQENAEQSTVNE